MFVVLTRYSACSALTISSERRDRFSTYSFVLLQIDTDFQETDIKEMRKRKSIIETLPEQFYLLDMRFIRREASEKGNCCFSSVLGSSAI